MPEPSWSRTVDSLREHKLFIALQIVLLVGLSVVRVRSEAGQLSLLSSLGALLPIVVNAGIGALAVTLIGSLFWFWISPPMTADQAAQAEERRQAQLATRLRASIGDTSAVRLTYLDDQEEIYRRLKHHMAEHKYMLNTIVDGGERVASPDMHRASFYEDKKRLVCSGSLHCKEVFSVNATSLADEITTAAVSVPPDRSDQVVYDGRIVSVGDLGTFVNFSVFLRDPVESDDGVLMLGWFSDESDGFHRHSCIETRAPHLVRMFANYFAILHRSGRIRAQQG